jgi:hypothetical protein
MIVHLAPPVVDGVSPFTTPGTRLSWSSGEDWTRCLDQLTARRHSAKRYADVAAHLDELARHPDFIAAQQLDDLVAMREVLHRRARDVMPPRGRRAGTSYERIVVELHNAMARQERLAS